MNGGDFCDGEGKCRAGIWNALPGLVLAATIVLASLYAEKDEPSSEKTAQTSEKTVQTSEKIKPPKQLAQVAPAPAATASAPESAPAPAATGSAPAPQPPQPAPKPQPVSAPVPPLPERAPSRHHAKREGKSSDELDAKALLPANVKAALKKCDKLKLAARVEYKLLPPIRKGRCGTPAPLLVKRFIGKPSVVVRPAATLNCRTANAFDRWLRKVVQPRAWALLNARIVRVRNLASYHCRLRNGGGGRKISEHAFANAIDIAEFVTSKGERIRVAKHWNAGDKRAQFLRQIHKGACGVFTTVLGPKANAAHRNHFHLDMKRRRYKAICQ
ncbi:MAG: extensin family protein [Alphaproteobacteria bacterium]